jgi:uncharacterized protein (TIGR02996 family)
MSDPSRLRTALEAALIDNPDDLAAHMAYADLLAEQGDPRGEFIQVQLALEDPTRPAEERRRLQARERELLDAHERTWLGELAPLLLGTPEERAALIRPEIADRHPDSTYWLEHLIYDFRWRRGWLSHFECGLLSIETARRLGRHPLARLLEELVFRTPYGSGDFRPASGPDIPSGSRGYYTYELLAGTPIFGNLRSFQYGQEADADEDNFADGTQFYDLAPIVTRMPRLEKLRIFGHTYGDGDMWRDMNAILSSPWASNLRVYQHYHATVYALEPFATNPALRNLTQILFYPHSFSRAFTQEDIDSDELDAASETPALLRENVRHILFSPHLPSLVRLQLRCCSGGDPMIDDIISSGILKRLRSLDLRFGHVTDAGARQLAACPDARGLQSLDLVGNRLTADGVRALTEAGIPVRADNQENPPYNDDRLLYYGDSE